jgi:hypothetical protein
VAFEQATIRCAPTTWRKIAAIKQEMEEADERSVTYSELLDRLAAMWNTRKVTEDAS